MASQGKIEAKNRNLKKISREEAVEEPSK